ncbi:MAG: ABC transporter permease [Patescibacteria group bacterium]|nr:ABC transporter permease [Patescibacteria group bacterium]
MKHLLLFTTKEFLILWRDKGALVMLLLVPIVLIVIASFALSGVFGGGKMDIKLPVINYDKEGEISQEIIAILENHPNITLEKDISKDEAQAKVGEGKYPAALIIPENFSQKITFGEKTELKLLYDPNSNVEYPFVKGVIEGIIEKINSIRLAIQTALIEVNKVNSQLDPEKIVKEAHEITQNLAAEGGLKLTLFKAREETREADPFAQNVPGYAIMFMLFGILGGIEALLEEKETGIFKRILSLPIKKYSLLGGKLLSWFLIAILQMAIILTIAHFIFDLYLGKSILALILVVSTCSFASTSIGTLISAFVKSKKTGHTNVYIDYFGYVSFRWFLVASLD